MTDRTRTTTILLIVLGLLALPFLLGPMTGLFGWGHMGTTTGSWGHMSGTGWGFGWLFALAVPLILVAVVGYLVIAALDDNGTDESEDEALAELRAAYARGEIDDEEFENRRWRLRQGEE
ncbi:SHOCT domain-containing protein [Halorubrum sp. DTA46]|uniref:SHOCT domain-containing protein n=1 Tax=Halorubrum sp. DTA46 TaxID=3402162 RepID=UPI003AACCA1B